MVLSAFFWARLAVLTLVLIAAIAVPVFFRPALGYALQIAISFVIAAVVSMAHLRHAGLAFSAAFGPVPGILIALALGQPSAVAALLYLPAFACAVFLADDIAQRIATGIDREIAVQDALAGLAASAGLAVLVPVVGLAAAFIFSGLRTELAAAVATIAAAITVIAIVPLSATFFSFDEDFVTDTNRLREWRERMLDTVTVVARPRWALSVTGMAIVFAVLALFGARNIAISPGNAIILGCFSAAALVAGFGLTHDWRRILSVPAVLLLTVLLAFWAFARAHIAFDLHNFFLLLQILAVCFAPLFLGSAEAGRYLSEDNAIAASLALLRKGPAIISFFLVAAFMSIETGNAAMILAECAILLFGGVGALFFQPAIAVALEALFPQRSTIAARYRPR